MRRRDLAMKSSKFTKKSGGDDTKIAEEINTLFVYTYPRT